MKEQANQPGHSVWQAARTVFWAFLGIRRRAHGELDIDRLKPAQIVAAGILGGALFVALLLVVVRVVIMGHGAST